MAPSVQRSLTGIKILADLSPEQLVGFERSTRWRRYRAKEQILDRESTGTDVYFVVDGKVEILNYSPGGREISFAEVARGGYFGELAALDGRKRSASAMAATDTTLASITAPTFKKLLLDHPEIALVVLLNLTEMVRNADDRIMDLSTLSAINRVHSDLLRLAKPGEPDGNTALIRPIPIHSDIASRAGTTRETVSRVLSHLARVHIVERTKDSLEVLDLQRLRDLIEPAGG